MIQFIDKNTDLGSIINDACNILYGKINALRIDEIDIEPLFREYFMKCHFNRQLFSLKTSANLLYEAIATSGKKHTEIVLMDYGAGLGTLYLLAKIIGVRKVIYNDLMPEFGHAARLIDQALGYQMDEYIVGDTLATCEELRTKKIECDIITSRNVLEHIYNLSYFFKLLHEYQPRAILYNSTTANWRNPATHIQHIYLHVQGRKFYGKEKLAHIKQAIPDIAEGDAKKLTHVLLQYGGDEFIRAIENYKLNKVMPPPKNDYTNFCTTDGNWGEHMIPYSSYISFAPQYTIEFKPGFWDVDYHSAIKQMLGKTMNVLTRMLGKQGVLTSSFIYIIAIPKASVQ